MKKIIRLTENDLHNIVKESVQKILREAEYDVNSDKWKANFDQMYNDVNWWEKENRDQTNKEIADYEALPDKARHPYGADIPDLSNRRGSRNNYGDKLAAKKPNSVLNQIETNKSIDNDYEKVMNSPYVISIMKKDGFDPFTHSKEEVTKWYNDYRMWYMARKAFEEPDYDY